MYRLESRKNCADFYVGNEEKANQADLGRTVVRNFQIVLLSERNSSVFTTVSKGLSVNKFLSKSVMGDGKFLLYENVNFAL